MPALQRMKIAPARIPHAVHRTERHGTTINAARYFGASTNSTGSMAIVRIASISSVTTMLPISAENAEPERPLTAIAVSSGPISRVKLIVTNWMTNCSAPKRRSSVAPCIARMNPEQTAMMLTMGAAWTPTASICTTADRHRVLRPTRGKARGNASTEFPN